MAPVADLYIRRFSYVFFILILHSFISSSPFKTSHHRSITLTLLTFYLSTTPFLLLPLLPPLFSTTPLLLLPLLPPLFHLLSSYSYLSTLPYSTWFLLTLTLPPYSTWFLLTFTFHPSFLPTSFSLLPYLPSLFSIPPFGLCFHPSPPISNIYIFSLPTPISSGSWSWSLLFPPYQVSYSSSRLFISPSFTIPLAYSIPSPLLSHFVSQFLLPIASPNPLPSYHLLSNYLPPFTHFCYSSLLPLAPCFPPAIFSQ